MPSFASGKHALALCDRCGMRTRYTELQQQVVNMVATNLLVCRDCLDRDHESYQLRLIDKSDPQALRNARPDVDRSQSLGFFGWNPVLGQSVAITVGKVQVN